jgi:hypothetical protein
VELCLLSPVNLPYVVLHLSREKTFHFYVETFPLAHCSQISLVFVIPFNVTYKLVEARASLKVPAHLPGIRATVNYKGWADYS